ncbi:hypothetical protein [Desulfovibrio piger]|uniref:hypothetical protein n=1 Tax=Desulfovibrio piger TaxID=901 RepID=UPI003A9494D4
MLPSLPRCYFSRCYRIISKRLRRYSMAHPIYLSVWMVGGTTLFFIICGLICGNDETTYTALGSYFTALAFVGVIATTLLQCAELQEQRKELRAQRRELEGQKRELEIQNRTAQLQRFENGFFHLLASFKNTLEALREQLMDDRFKKNTSAGEKQRGKVCFALHNNLKHILLQAKSFKDEQEYIKKEISNLPSNAHKFIDEYHMIVNFVCSSKSLNNSEYINYYISIININLSNKEYSILFYDGIVRSDHRHFINRYGLLKKYRLKNILGPLKPEHILFFAPQAFGEDYEEYIRLNGLQGKTLEDFLQ